MLSTLLAFAVASPQTSLAAEVELLFQSRTEANARRMFQDRRDAEPLVDFMIRNREPATWAMIPSPPGLHGQFQLIFSRFQDIEQEVDVQFEVDGKINRLIPEHQTFNYRIKDLAMVAKLDPPEHKISVDATINLAHDAPAQSMVARLNSPYQIDKAWVDGKEARVITVDKAASIEPQNGDVIRAGSLVIVWTHQPISKLRLTYSGLINEPRHDKITPQAAYVTAWWVPSIGRLPHVTDVTVQAPAGWQFRSEGVPAEASMTEPTSEGMVWKRWKCAVPISFPKIIGGDYKLAFELVEGGRTFRSWQFEPVSEARGKKDCALMVKAMAFLESNLCPYPWDSFECYDADTYYGIESYSHTLLQTRLTTKFVTHELTHTWFGGFAPSAYSKDSWNEGVTQYVDSVLFGKNADGTLETGYDSHNIKVPLSAMNVAHSYGSQSYYRGAYVMNMLAEEIGMESMWRGLKALTTDFRGQELTWPKLKEVFEAVSGQELDWFWDQWVTNGVFPYLNQPYDFRRNGDGTASVIVTQYGTAKPFRFGFDFLVRRADHEIIEAKHYQMDGGRMEIRFKDPGPGGYIGFGLKPFSLTQLGDGQPGH